MTSDITVTHMNTVFRNWGHELIPNNIAKFRCKFGIYKGISVFEVPDTQEFSLDYFWNRVTEEVIRNPSDALRWIKEARWHTNQLLPFLSALQFTHLRSFGCCLMKVRSCSVKVAVNSIEGLITEGDKQGVWEDFYEFNFTILPYFIQFSQHKSKHIRKFKECRIRYSEDFKGALRSLLLASLCGPEGSECFEEVRSLIHEAEVEEYYKPFVDILLQADQTNLREWISGFSTKAGRPLLTLEVPVWETIVLLILKGEKDASLDLKKIKPKCWAEVLAEVFSSTPCCRVLGVLQNIKQIVSRDLLTTILMEKAVLGSIWWGTKRYGKNRFRPSDYEKTCALMGIVEFYLNVFGNDANLKWAARKLSDSQNPLVLSIPVELLTVASRLTQEGVAGDFQLNLENLIRNSFVSPLTIWWLAEYKGSKLDYRRESEWEVLFETLQMKPLTIRDPNCDPLYQETYSPMLRVWTRFFGKKETRRAADEEGIWFYAKGDMKDGELLHVAIELGSESEVKQMAWPGLLKWKSQDGRTARDISVETWGTDQEITKFLEERERVAKHLHA